MRARARLTDEARPLREGPGLHAIDDPQLAEDVGDVDARRLPTDVEGRGDLAVRPAGADQGQDLHLARSEVAALDERRGRIESPLPGLRRVGCLGSVPGRRRVQARASRQLLGRRDEWSSAEIPGCTQRRPKRNGGSRSGVARRPRRVRAAPWRSASAWRNRCVGSRIDESETLVGQGGPLPAGWVAGAGRAARLGGAQRVDGVPDRRVRGRPPERHTAAAPVDDESVRDRALDRSGAPSSPTARAISARSAAILIAMANSDPVGSSSTVGGRPPIAAAASSWAGPVRSAASSASMLASQYHAAWMRSGVAAREGCASASPDRIRSSSPDPAASRIATAPGQTASGPGLASARALVHSSRASSQATQVIGGRRRQSPPANRRTSAPTRSTERSPAHRPPFGRPPRGDRRTAGRSRGSRSRGRALRDARGTRPWRAHREGPRSLLSADRTPSGPSPGRPGRRPARPGHRTPERLRWPRPRAPATRRTGPGEGAGRRTGRAPGRASPTADRRARAGRPLRARPRPLRDRPTPRDTSAVARGCSPRAVDRPPAQDRRGLVAPGRRPRPGLRRAPRRRPRAEAGRPGPGRAARRGWGSFRRAGAPARSGAAHRRMRSGARLRALPSPRPAGRDRDVRRASQ